MHCDNIQTAVRAWGFQGQTSTCTQESGINALQSFEAPAKHNATRHSKGNASHSSQCVCCDGLLCLLPSSFSCLMFSLAVLSGVFWASLSGVTLTFACFLHQWPPHGNMA